MLEVIQFTLGPVSTNTYLAADRERSQAVVIDPAWEGGYIFQEADKAGLDIVGIWLTHAHFDHYAGASELLGRLGPAAEDSLPYGLHPEDLPLWERKGGSLLFGFDFQQGPEPNLSFRHGDNLELGSLTFEVRYAPGHSPGHVMFYCPAAEVLFSGDVIFRQGIGRTDLPGGDHQTLIRSIQREVLTLPDETVIYPGHGPQTTVGEERRRNPFLS